MADRNARSPAVTPAAILVAAAGSLWFALLGALLVVVPLFKRAWDRAGRMLPSWSVQVLDAAAWARDYAWVLFIAAPLVLVLIALAAWLARGRRAALYALFVPLIVVPALLLVLVALGLVLP